MVNFGDYDSLVQNILIKTEMLIDIRQISPIEAIYMEIDNVINSILNYPGLDPHFVRNEVLGLRDVLGVVERRLAKYYYSLSLPNRHLVRFTIVNLTKCLLGRLSE